MHWWFWIMKNNEEAGFDDLRSDQHVHVWYIPRGGLAVAVEILSSQPTGRKTR
jgi:hypothetical protein